MDLEKLSSKCWLIFLSTDLAFWTLSLETQWFESDITDILQSTLASRFHLSQIAAYLEMKNLVLVLTWKSKNR